MNTKEILSYLKVALDMETDRFMAQELIEKIRQQMSSLGHSRSFAKPSFSSVHPAIIPTVIPPII